MSAAPIFLAAAGAAAPSAAGTAPAPCPAGMCTSVAVPVALQLGAMRDGPAGGGVYQVVAIDAGVGNGWEFSPEVIEAATPLFNRLNVYLGHAGPQDRGPNGERRPEALAGVFADGTFDPAAAAIRGRLRLAGPAAGMARAVADAYLYAYQSGEPAPDVGLSAALYLAAEGRRVLEITGVESLDVIATKPARGGRFEAALSRVVEDEQMREAVQVALAATVDRGRVTGDELQGTADGGQGIGDGGAEARASSGADGHAATAPALDTTAAALVALQQQIAQLQAAMAAAVTPAVVQNLGQSSDGGRRDGAALAGTTSRISMGNTPLDQLQTAVDAMFGVRLPAGAAFSRLRSYKQLYLLVTGDHELRGIFDGERAEFANATSTTLNDLTKNALNKYCQQYFQDAYLWWEQIAQIVEFGTLQDPTWITLGGFGDLPTVVEGASYTELTIADTGETSQWTKKGGFIGITLEAIDKDDTGKITQIPQKLAASAYRTLSAAVAGIFTANAGAGPVLQDTFNLFSANHSNVGVTALSSAAWEAAIQGMYRQPELNSTRRLGARPERLVVPVELEATAAQIVGSEVMDANLQRNVRKGSAQVVTCPDFTDANDWAAVADPTKNPAIGVGFRFGRVPEVFSDPGGQRMFTNDQLDLKARFFFTVGVIDWRAALKRNVP